MGTLQTTLDAPPTVLARQVIGNLLDGQSPNGVTPAQLGPFGELYDEMCRAHQAGGKEAARKIFVMYAEQSAEIAALRAADPPQQKKSWTVNDLYNAEFPAPRYTVPGLLTAGLAILAARPKIGKSWLGLQTSIAVGTGGTVLGQRVEKGKVLYLALEDSPRRIKERLTLQHAPANADVRFEFGWRPLPKEGTADLIGEIDKHGYTLVVVDTLARALGFVDPNKQAENNIHLGVLQRTAVDRNMTILLIDHQRKNNAGSGDVIDDILGATSKAGVLDIALGLYRNRGEQNAILKATGRDIDERELAVDFDRNTGSWQLLGTASGIKADTLQASILEALDEMGGKTTATKLAGWLGRDRSNLRKELLELVNKGVIKRNAEKAGREVLYELVK